MVEKEEEQRRLQMFRNPLIVCYFVSLGLSFEGCTVQNASRNFELFSSLGGFKNASQCPEHAYFNFFANSACARRPNNTAYKVLVIGMCVFFLFLLFYSFVF